MEMVPGTEKETVRETSPKEGRVLVIQMENIDKGCLKEDAETSIRGAMGNQNGNGSGQGEWYVYLDRYGDGPGGGEGDCRGHFYGGGAGPGNSDGEHRQKLLKRGCGDFD